MKYTMPENKSKSEYLKTNFNIIAKKYDLFNDLSTFFLHRWWKKICIQHLVFSEVNLKVLDLCCGTGDFTLRLVAQKEVDQITALDFSEGMLSVAKNRIRNSTKVTFCQGDATDLKEFKNGTFDRIIMGFGLRNVNSIQLCLSEVYRVLKPGGLFINLDVGKVKIPVIRWFADLYFYRIVPLLGYLVWSGKNEMFDYLPASSRVYPGQEEISKLLEETGFKNVKFKNFVFGNTVMHLGKK